MKLSEFLTCWRECVPEEFPIDLEQLKVSPWTFVCRDRTTLFTLGFDSYLRRHNFLY